jgi:MFS family permease
LVLALPFYVLLRLVTHDAIQQIVLLCALLVLIGVAIALIVPPVMAEFIYIVDKKERQQPGLFGSAGAYAQAYGIFITAWAAGYLVGPVWAGFVETKAGWSTMTWSLGAFSAVSAIPILAYTGGFITRRKTETYAGR